MVIIGVLAGTAIPVYIGMGPSIRLSGATRQIMGDLMWARMQAISQNNRFRIFFLNNHQYKILDDDNSNNAIDTGETVILKDLQDKFLGVTFATVPSQNPIFYPKGTFWPLGMTVNLTNSFGTKTITVSSTGRVKIN